ncbi:hypothetical protein RvY_02244 [Ramazzottius varieornatus]|uniref:Uncharacterized protein n=1 Tax=Ramazzottius varieornatus TaxID=947166 RepID=A0A1D1UJV5_RAMVA|nr:hypothetical protein RvY_02244 [Ramazzottius varieornatus]
MYLMLWNIVCFCALAMTGLHNVHGHLRHRRQTNTTVHLSHSSKNAADRVQVTSKPTVAKFGCFPNILAEPVPSNKLKKLGFSYGYRANSIPDQPQPYNVWINTSFVDSGLVYLPDTMIPAIHAVQHTHTTFKINDTIICDLQDTNLLSRYDGVDHFVSFDSDSMDVPRR